MKLCRVLFAIFGIAILTTSLSLAQTQPPCSRFNNGLDGWTPENATATWINGVADLNDDPFASNFVAPASYKGNWLGFVQDCGELCFDINIIDDSLPTSAPVYVAFTITDNAGHSASFRHTPVVEGSGWRTFCAPIGPLVGGNLPNNGQGTWTLGSGTTTADWTALLSGVQTLKFAVDFAGAGSQDEHYQIDNICFRPNTCAKANFTPPSGCPGAPGLTFNNTSTGATSSVWTFPGANPSTSTQTSPTGIVYPNPGTYQATLCINGGTAAPLCLTQNVTVNPVPPIPVITGPPVACQTPSSYCVTPVAGVTYAWSVLPPGAGTATPATGSCTNVLWTNPSNLGVVVVTATNQFGCKSVRRLEVPGCDTHNTCCQACPKPTFNIPSWTMQYVSGNTYSFRPQITTTSQIKRVVIDIISADVSYTPASCGTPRAIPMTITLVSAPAPPTTPQQMNGSQPVPNSTEAIWWNSNPVNQFNNVTFPMNVTLPPRPPNCSDKIRFCVKYTITDVDCRSCEIIRCYEFNRELHPSPATD